MADNQKHITPTAELVRQYLEGKLDGKTMHALEKQALDDPFLADALEGYAKYPTDQRSALSELQERLQQRVAPAEKKVRRLDYRWLAAASVLLILCISGVLILNRTQEAPGIAQTIKEEKHADTAIVHADGVVSDSAAAAPAADAANVASSKVKAPAANAEPALDRTVAAAAPKVQPQPQLRSTLKVQPPPAPASMSIRGISTIKDSANSPLVLMDGIPTKLDSINPAAIENIQILKDATASAVYGSRAANGVVLVTTKKGKPLDSAFAFYNKIDTVHIGSNKPIAGKLDSKVEGLVTGAKSNFSNYYQDDNVQKISGVVVDEKTGKRIPGVTVHVKGTNNGAVTDTSGSFALHIAGKSKSELAFSFLGYEQKKVTVSQSTSNLNVALPASNAHLSETVIAGYSKKERKAAVTTPVPLVGDEAYSVYLVTGKTVGIPGLKVPQEGKVRISFTVMPDSTLQDFKVLQGMGKVADSIAIQRIKEGPAWMPASNKKKATVEVTVPIELIKKEQ